MNKWTLYQIDAWSEGERSWTYNTWYSIGTYEQDDQQDNKQAFLSGLHSILGKKPDMRRYTVETYPNPEIRIKKTDEPLFFAELVEEV